MRSSWGVQSLGCLLPLSLHPVSQGRVLNLARTTGLDFSLGLFFWLMSSGLQGRCQGSSWGLQLPLQGGHPLEQDCGVIEASVLVLIPEPTTLVGHTNLSSFLGVGGVNWRWGGGSKWPSPWWAHRVPALCLWTGCQFQWLKIVLPARNFQLQLC